MDTQTILTGLRANNDLHIGNYFGALLPLVQMARERADEYTVNLFVPDLHSFTTPIDHSKLQEQILHNLRIFAAAGLPLDNDNIHVYRQSYISAHSELTVILNCFTGMGEMGRMTQFKDKSSGMEKAILKQGVFTEADGRASGEASIEYAKSRVSVGLFDYPVLMAADILLYNAVYVPVGDDQTQHLEFARDIAERMNNKFGELLTVPKSVQEQHKFFGKEQGLRIKDLVDPTKKMSKSDESEKGIIFLGDEPKAAAKKIMSATTDNEGIVRYDKENQPGIANLLEIHALLGTQPLDEVIAEFENSERYGDLKKAVAERVETFLTDFQAKLDTVNDEELHTKLEVSEAAMNTVANETLLRVQKAVGLR